ncbi:uncharacterized protein LACBIDRAFT_305815 [Laccaria bicolor S238N-H82]|uniref:Predicted protein n=1 Tax=Laccaria bicolor (strain S238N-H82 / ATCC MYA-4686) TaxID=486041 RepID=B0CS01_LACBS|nr:uncharacterized protein LACBIDRAFT_305815 [Laccaria bicolor S238N-H82]EDR14769.1 predicted protein [Laccaria bicolor S238N-H82]|eukprot:XP_001875328.1 predicted protein [Laccaria bicolor S238N-H82]
MVDTPDSGTEPTEIELSVVARLTFYKAGNNGKGKKQTKDIKAKTFNHNFSESKDNYLELLTAILEKHHVDKKYKVTARNVYPCKIQVHPAKQGDAPDVVNYEEYQDLVKNTILSAPVGKPVVIFVEMPSIEKSAKRVKAGDNEGGSSSDDEGAACDGDDDDNPGLSKEEYDLAKERAKLKKKYQNDHDGGYTYIDATGVSIPLTPFMMKEWARALVDKDKSVDIDNPPHTQTFDPANRKSSLLTRKRSESSGSTGTEHVRSWNFFGNGIHEGSTHDVISLEGAD